MSNLGFITIELNDKFFLIFLDGKGWLSSNLTGGLSWNGNDELENDFVSEGTCTSFKTTFLVEAETEEPYLFKLANTKKIILKQMNTEKETFFELNDYHRFYLISDTYIGLHFSKPHLAIIGSDEKKFESKDFFKISL